MSIEEKRIYMESLISAWHSSGKSKREYCVEKGISSSTFYYWFSRNKASCNLSKDFVEIERAKLSAGVVEVIYPNGVKLQVGADLALLSQLIRLY